MSKTLPPFSCSYYKGLLTLLIILFFVSLGTAQNTAVSGKVTSKVDNEPLTGVNISIKGTTQGTVSDIDGNFVLDAPSDATLVFEYTGFGAQEIPVNNQTVITVTLSEDVDELNQVVVVGYGTQRKRDVTGAISSISPKDISNVRSANVVESMQGKVAGVDMTRASGRSGANYNISIRGNRSLTGSNDPLFIVDGIQYQSNVDINPNDVESMEILKDASSTAVYGARGANGVIIITTKKGKKGEPRLSFNTYAGITLKNGNLPLGDRDYYLKVNQDVIWMNNIGNRWATWNTAAKATPGQYFGLSTREVEGVALGTNTNWLDKVLKKNGTQQDYNLTLSGGSDKLLYSVSLNHYRESGLLIQDDFKRYNLRLNLDAPIKKFLTIGTNTLVTYSQQNFRDAQPAGDPYGNPLNNVRQLSPIVTPYVDNATGKMTESGSLVFYPAFSKLINANPLISEDPNYSLMENRLSKVFSTIYADFNFLNAFTFRTAINADLGFLRWGRFSGTYPVSTAPGVSGGGNLSAAEVTNNINTNYQWQNVLTYTKEIGDHRFQVTGVNEVLYRRGENYRIAVNDIALVNSQWYNLGSQTGIRTPTLGLSTTDEFGNNLRASQERYPLEVRKLLSYLGRFFYSYKGKYSLQLSGRYDGASQLQKKWSFFPSASAAWNISEESFVKSVPVISNLKLRAGYGISGNYDVNIFSTLGKVSTNPLFYNFGLNDAPSEFATGYRSVNIVNPNLGWEKTTAYNFGLDYGVFRGRIQGSVDVYQTTTNDLLQDQLLSPTGGISRVTTNIGSTQNRGIELALTSNNIQTEIFSWSTTFTFASNQEKILELASGRQQDIANGWFVGSPVQVWYDRKKIGIWQLNEIEEAAKYGATPGDIKFADLDGNPTTVDRTIIGTIRPKWTGGFNTTFTLMGFDLNVFLYARVGQTVQDNVYATFQPDGRTNMMQIDYWTPENPTNEAPRLNSSRTNAAYADLTSLTYTDGTFFKIRDITLGYTLPTALISKAKISRVRVYVTAKNAFIFSKLFNKEGGRWDPELNSNASQGSSAGTTFSTNGLGLPLPKMFAAGLNFEF